MVSGLVMMLCLFSLTESRAQVVINETFDTYVNTAPLGWNWFGVSGSTENANRWLDRNNTLPQAPNPAPLAHSGTNYMFYNAIGAVAGDQAYLVSKSYDLSARAANPASVRFWMYRDNASAFTDSVSIWVGNSPDIASATRLGMLSRLFSVAPAAGANTWNQYTYALPAGINTSHTYIFFLGTSRTGRDILIDDFSIDTWPSAMTFTSTTMWNQGVQIVSKSSTNEAVIGICIITNNAATPLNLYRITFNANGSSNPLADIQNAKLWYTGQSNSYKVLAPTTNQVGAVVSPVTTGSKIAFMNAGAIPPPLITLTNDTNYFWLSYDIKATATPNNFVDAEFDSVVVGTSFATAVYSAPATATMTGAVQIDPYCIPSSSTACVACYVQGVYMTGANGSKISTGSSSLAAPVNTGAMNNGTLYCFWNCISPPLGTTLRYKLFPPITNQTATLNTGTQYQLKLQFGQITGNIGAWIDYNNDYDFDDTIFAGGLQYYERLGLRLTSGTVVGCTGGGCSVVGGNTNSQNCTITFTLPPSGAPGLVYGNHRLRIREISLFTGTITPCTNYMHGETEDYIITIIPNCVLGLCQWLGYTDDWNTASNWCPNIPTINDIARVDFSYSFTPAANYYKPKIKSGVAATCKTLRIANTDTVYISTPMYNESTGTGLAAAASLTIADSMRINYNTASGTGALRVVSNKADSAQLSNGGFGFNITPFQSSKINNRMQMIFTKAELNARGMIEGDVIDSMVFYIKALSAGATDNYKLFTIQVANLLTPGWGWPVPPITSWAPTGPFTTVFGPTTLDIRTVQATHPNAIPAVPGVTAANRGQLSLVMLPNTFVWDGVSDIVIDICFNNIPAGGLPATNVLLSQTQTTGLRSVCWANNASNAGTAGLCNVNFPLPGGVGNIAVSSDYRPNVTFKYRRPYIKTLISMTGDVGSPKGFWTNNGTFTAGWSEVKFTGNLNDQEIGGSSITTFNDLTIDQGGSKVTMLLNANVDSTLRMTTGELTLNRNTLTLNYGNSTALQRTGGWIRSEDQPPGNYSTVNWNVGANAGVHTIPFGINASTYIPFQVTPSSDLGILSVTTYNTATNNQPYPVASGPYTINVMHMRSQATGTDISITDVVDRFWQINKTGPGTNATLAFGYKPTAFPGGEEPAAGPFTYVPQRFQIPGGTGSAAGGWALPGVGVNSAGSVSIALAADPISGPWTIGNLSNPLPVELLNFDAQLIGTKVKTYWSTATETDNAYFEVERTTDSQEFDFIAKVSSRGNSTKEQYYEAWDEKPLNGLQYYRLKTVDLNGDAVTSKLVPVRISGNSIFVINFVYADADNQRTWINMDYNSNLPYSIRITDVYGRTVFYRDENVGLTGENIIRLEQVLAIRGIYFVTLENKTGKAVKRFVY